MKSGWMITTVLSAAFLSGPATAGESGESGYAPIRPISQCLDPSRARSWTLLDSSRLLVDAGRNKYLIELAWSCPELATQPTLKFSSRAPSGRVCGDVGERVLGGGLPAKAFLPPPGQEAGCLISRASRLTADEYEAELRAESGSSATVRGSVSPGG